MERIQCGSIAALVVFAGIAVVRPARAAVEYRLTIIAPGGATSINDSGEVAGTLEPQNGFVYQNGNLTGFVAGSTTQIFGINASGVAAGIINGTSPFSQAFARRADGSFVYPPLNTAYAINDAGVLAGSVPNGNAVDAATYDGNTVTELPTLGGNSGIAFGINNAGLVVGRARDAAGNDHAVFWSNGQVNVLSSKASVAEAVNLSGRIVGSNYFSGVGSDSINHATEWLPDGSTIDLTPDELIGSSAANAINDAGVIAGYDGFATIWRDGVEQNLNDLIAPGSGVTLYNAFDINNAGQIVGEARNSAFVPLAFLLTPIPEPGLGLFALGLVVMCGLRRHERALRAAIR